MFHLEVCSGAFCVAIAFFAVIVVVLLAVAVALLAICPHQGRWQGQMARWGQMASRATVTAKHPRFQAAASLQDRQLLQAVNSPAVCTLIRQIEITSFPASSAHLFALKPNLRPDLARHSFNI